jgi:hypothetical protein
LLLLLPVFECTSQLPTDTRAHATDATAHERTCPVRAVL